MQRRRSRRGGGRKTPGRAPGKRRKRPRSIIGRARKFGDVESGRLRQFFRGAEAQGQITAQERRLLEAAIIDGVSLEFLAGRIGLSGGALGNRLALASERAGLKEFIDSLERKGAKK